MTGPLTLKWPFLMENFWFERFKFPSTAISLQHSELDLLLPFFNKLTTQEANLSTTGVR